MDASEIGVVFDCDGTLLDSMGVWHGLQNELAERAGGTLTADDVAALAPMSIPECGAFFHEKFGLGESDRDVVGMIDEYMLDFYRNRAEARPGALEFVQGLAQAGVHLTVASSSPKPYLMAGVQRCGFAPYLERVLSVEDVHSTKREPDVWDRACEIMGTSKQLTWGVEDSAYAIGTLGGAGYRTLAIYDSDDAGTWDALQASAEHAIRQLRGPRGRGIPRLERAAYLRRRGEQVGATRGIGASLIKTDGPGTIDRFGPIAICWPV